MAAPFSLSGEYRLELEGGVATALGTSRQPLIVQNNSGPGAPYAVVPLVGTDALDYGTLASYSARLAAGLQNGTRLYLRAEGVQGSGTRDLSTLFTVAGAIPGTHDDGRLVRNTWSPLALTTTSTQAYSAGLGGDFGTGFSWSAGIIHAQVAQDLNISYDVAGSGTQDYNVYGRSLNRMTGVDIGLDYRRDISDRVSFETGVRVAGMGNSYAYTYDYINSTVTPSQYSVGATGVSMVVRSEVSVKMSYAVRDNLRLTGRIGMVNYENVGTGLENLLNPANTHTVINPVTASVRLPYIRIGIDYRF